MGSSRNPKKSGLPKQVFPNQDDAYENEMLIGQGLADGSDGENTLQELAFYIVQTDPDVHTISELGDPVWIESEDGLEQVLTANGRIENVPYHKVNAIKNMDFQEELFLN